MSEQGPTGARDPLNSRPIYYSIKFLRDDFKKNGLFSDIDQESLLLEALEIVTSHWGGWVSKEHDTISKQTF